jgi:hypothetical protein
MISSNNPALQLKKFIIFFFAYMIFEGVLRKWILPNFQTYIYFVKDFLLIFIYFYAIKYNFLFNKTYSKLFIFFIIIISLYGLIGYQLDFQGILSYLLGLRSYWLYAPLTLIMVHVFDIDDVKKFLKINLYSIFPYFILILFQSYSSDTSIINSGFNSMVTTPDRPSGFFIHITQNSYYLAFMFACLYSKISITSNLTVKKFIYYLVLIFILLSVMILLKSRSVYILNSIIVIYSFLTILFYNKKNYFKLKKLIIIGIFTPLLFLLTKNIFKDEYNSSASRFNTDTYYEMKVVKEYKSIKLPSIIFSKDNNQQVTVIEFCNKYSSLCRIINEIYFIPIIYDSSLYGAGIGAGTSAVAAFTENIPFTLGEVENNRVIMELGYYVGPLFVLLKYFMVLFFHILFFFKNENKLLVAPMLPLMCVLIAMGPVTYSASFISFILWFYLGAFVLSLKISKSS